MLDVAVLRDDPDTLTATLERRGVMVDIAGLRALDAERRSVRGEAEELRARQKEAGKAIAELDVVLRLEAKLRCRPPPADLLVVLFTGPDGGGGIGEVRDGHPQRHELVVEGIGA